MAERNPANIQVHPCKHQNGNKNQNVQYELSVPLAEKSNAAPLSVKRKIIQFLSAILYNAYLPGFSGGYVYSGSLKGFCVPGLNCYSCPGALGACPVGSLQDGLSFARYKLPFYVCGTLLFFGVLIGRVVCGFVCPFGLIQELLYRFPSPKIKKNRFTFFLSYFKYAVLLLLVIVAPLVWQTPAFCKYICPQGIIEGALPLLAVNNSVRELLGALFLWKFVVLIIIVTVSVLILRPFCRFICPLGALYGLFSKWSIFGVFVSELKCTHCQKCVRACPVDVRSVGDRECIQCGDCISVCPEKAVKFGKKQF